MLSACRLGAGMRRPAAPQLCALLSARRLATARGPLQLADRSAHAARTSRRNTLALKDAARHPLHAVRPPSPLPPPPVMHATRRDTRQQRTQFARHSRLQLAQVTPTLLRGVHSAALPQASAPLRCLAMACSRCALLLSLASGHSGAIPLFKSSQVTQSKYSARGWTLGTLCYKRHCQRRPDPCCPVAQNNPDGTSS